MKNLNYVLPMVFFLAGLSLCFFSFNSVLAKTAQVESSLNSEANLLTPIIDTKTQDLALSLTAKVQTQSLLDVPGANLIQNSSVETATSSGLPLGWSKGGYGTNTRTLSYPVSGYSGGKAVKVEITSYTNGDAKWFFADAPVTPGNTYIFSDYYISNIPSIIDVRYTMSDGSYSYKDLLSLDANPGTNFIKASTQFVVPTNVVAVNFFHLIEQVGYLTTDEYFLNNNTVIVPPDQTNLIPNSDFEQTGSNGLPLTWKKGGWGTNTSNFLYPTTSYDGSKAVSLSISKYTSGDAKWYFVPLTLAPGVYTYSDNFTSNVSSVIDVQLQNADGTYSYKDLAFLPPTSAFINVAYDFFVPIGTQNVTVFHLIEGIGTISLDNTALRFKKELSGIFLTGAVTFRFDDGWLSQYQNAVPKLNSAGYKATFYIVSRQLFENGFSGFLNATQLKDIYNQGYEIGAHTETHLHLMQLTQSQQQSEIQGSRNDLIAMGLGPVSSFSYPYGEYNATTLQIVKDSGFLNAASTINQYVLPTSDKYQLERKEINASTTISQIKAMIDEASNNKKWLVFEIHQVLDTTNPPGDIYSITKTIFDQTVDYVVQKKIPVVTISQGAMSL